MLLWRGTTRRARRRIQSDLRIGAKRFRCEHNRAIIQSQLSRHSVSHHSRGFRTHHTLTAKLDPLSQSPYRWQRSFLWPSASLHLVPKALAEATRESEDVLTDSVRRESFLHASSAGQCLSECASLQAARRRLISISAQKCMHSAR